MTSFMELIYSATVEGHGADNLCWQRRSKGGFAVTSFYQCLSPPSSMTFTWKGIWKPKVPPWVVFFMWTAALRKILTADNLRKWNIVIVSWCCMCKVDGESIDHLFLHCPVAKELWDAVLHLFELHWVMPRRAKEQIEGWYGGLSKHRPRNWNAVPHCLMWILWRERNFRTFEDSKTITADLSCSYFEHYLSGCKPRT